MPGSAYTAVTQGNARRQAEARAAGRATFAYEWTELRPGCVACGQAITSTRFADGRVCNCPGMWRIDWTTGEWVRDAPEPTIPDIDEGDEHG